MDIIILLTLFVVKHFIVDFVLQTQYKFWIPEVPNASHAWSVFYRQNKQSWWNDYVRPADVEYVKDILKKAGW